MNKMNLHKPKNLLNLMPKLFKATHLWKGYKPCFIECVTEYVYTHSGELSTECCVRYEDGIISIVHLYDLKQFTEDTLEDIGNG